MTRLNRIAAQVACAHGARGGFGAVARHADGPLQVIVCNTTHDDYVGKLAVGRIARGRVRVTEELAVVKEQGRVLKGNVKQLFVFEGLKRVPKESVEAGDVVAIAGIDEANIGDTLADLQNPVALTRISVEPPTIKVRFYVNTSPFAGREGKWGTSRRLRERLYDELRHLSPDDRRVDLLLQNVPRTARAADWGFASDAPPSDESSAVTVQHRPRWAKQRGFGKIYQLTSYFYFPRRVPSGYSLYHVTTQTMVMTGEADLRTPMGQSEEYYRALKMLKKPTLLVRMPDEFHGWRRPSHQLLQQLYLMAWFDKHRAKPAAEATETGGRP